MDALYTHHVRMLRNGDSGKVEHRVRQVLFCISLSLNRELRLYLFPQPKFPPHVWNLSSHVILVSHVIRSDIKNVSADVRQALLFRRQSPGFLLC